MLQDKPDSNFLKSKQHFAILDGLRGVAALIVVVFHFLEWIYYDYSKNFLGHGFLAVDFFFCLSGFVIAYSYDDRIAKIGVIEFFKSRLIRLHPLVIIGSVIGLLCFFFDPFAADQSSPSSADMIWLAFTCSILLIPLPTIPERAFNLFSFNTPSWSLFWEYVVNIIYAFFLYRISLRWLVKLTILTAVLLCILSYNVGNLMGGWAGNNFSHGAVRVAYSFSAGLLVYRLGWIIKNRLSFISLSILLCVAFVMPLFKVNWLVEAVIVLFYFPLLVALGAGASLSPLMKKLCNFSGKISYPLYMTHYWAMWIFGGYLNNKKPDINEIIWVIIIGTILLIGFAWLIMVLIDEPIRKWLTNKRNTN